MTTADATQAWLVAQIARELDLDPAAVDPSRPIGVLGLDSLAAATLVADLEDLVGRPLPETLFRENQTIAELSRLVADGAPAVPREPRPAAPPGADYAALEYGSWTFTQRVLQRMACGLARALTRQDVAGLEQMPSSGAVVFAINHLHMLDALWIFAVVRRPTIFLVAHEYRHRPVVGWLLARGNAIFVARGTGDRHAIEQAVRALKAGAAVAIAPEGRLSRTGGLLQGQPGVARLAAAGRAPVMPIGMSGQERLWRNLLRGRRVPIRISGGAPIDPPAESATAKELEAFTERIMKALARTLPSAYRGVYAGC